MDKYREKKDETSLYLLPAIEMLIVKIPAANVK